METRTLLEMTRSALTAAHGLGLQQITTPHRMPNREQTWALQHLARIALKNPNWKPGGTFGALATDPIAADIWAAGLIAQGVA